MKIAVYIMAIGCMSVLILHHLIRLPGKRTMTDDLEEAIMPLKPMIGNHTCISFISNNPSLEIYFRSQFLMVPVILSKEQDQDTMLFVEDLSRPPLSAQLDSIPHRIIATYLRRNFRVSMLLKEK